MGFKSEDEKKLQKLTSYAWVLVLIFILLAVTLFFTGFKLVKPKPKCIDFPEYLVYEKHSLNDKGEFSLALTSSKNLTLSSIELDGELLVLADKSKSVVSEIALTKDKSTEINALGSPQKQEEKEYSKQLRLTYFFEGENRKIVSIASCTGVIE